MPFHSRVKCNKGTSVTNVDSAIVFSNQHISSRDEAIEITSSYDSDADSPLTKSSHIRKHNQTPTHRKVQQANLTYLSNSTSTEYTKVRTISENIP